MTSETVQFTRGCRPYCRPISFRSRSTRASVTRPIEFPPRCYRGHQLLVQSNFTTVRIRRELCFVCRQLTQEPVPVQHIPDELGRRHQTIRPN